MWRETKEEGKGLGRELRVIWRGSGGMRVVID